MTSSSDAKPKQPPKPETSGAKQANKGQFPKGKSGNPAGRPRGARHKITLLAERMIGADAKPVVAKVIAMAKAGNEACLRLLMDRMMPPLKTPTVRLQLPELRSAADAATATAAIARAAASGELSPDQAQQLAAIVGSWQDQRQQTELSDRIARLEALLHVKA